MLALKAKLLSVPSKDKGPLTHLKVLNLSFEQWLFKEIYQSSCKCKRQHVQRNIIFLFNVLLAYLCAVMCLKFDISTKCWRSCCIPYQSFRVGTQECLHFLILLFLCQEKRKKERNIKAQVRKHCLLKLLVICIKPSSSRVINRSPCCYHMP